MKIVVKLLAGVTSLIVLVGSSYAFPGDMGYEGGVIAGIDPTLTNYPYQEVNLLSGQPIVLKGTIGVKKAIKSDAVTKTDTITTTYSYLLRNDEKKSSITRSLVLVSKIENLNTDQKRETTSISGKPTETVSIDGNTYTLNGYEFSKSTITDIRPGVEFYAGNISGRKKYIVKQGSGQPMTGYDLTVDIKGKVFGFAEYFNTVETINITQNITGNGIIDSKPENWTGEVKIKISNKDAKNIKYDENEPDTISFEGGYVEETDKRGMVDYSYRMPEFDSNKRATHRIIRDSGKFQLESFPKTSRFQIERANNLRGHWAENDVRELMSQDIIRNDGTNFNPDELVKRSEFAEMLVRSAKEPPQDPIFGTVKKKSSTGGTKAKSAPLQSFIDVGGENPYYQSIEEGYKRNLFVGRGDRSFYPDDYIVMAESLKMMINAIGIEDMAKWPGSITNFRDNDIIPDYARNAVKAAQKIGMVRGDDRGYLRPNENLTRARAAVMINNFIKYLRSGLQKDYIEHVVDFK